MITRDFENEEDRKRFEEMAHLYRTDSEEFERRTRAEIDRTIEGMPVAVRARLRGVQFSIDAQLARCKDPIVRLNKMVDLLWKGVLELEAALNGHVPEVSNGGKGADIVPFLQKGKKESDA